MVAIRQLVKEQCDFHLFIDTFPLSCVVLNESHFVEPAVLVPDTISNPGSFISPTPKGAMEERPWLRLVMYLGDKFMFVGGVLVFRKIVTVGQVFLTYKTDLFSHLANMESPFLIAQWNFTIIPSAFKTGSENCEKCKNAEF